MKVLDWTKTPNGDVWLLTFAVAYEVAARMPVRPGRIRVWVPRWFGRATGQRRMPSA